MDEDASLRADCGRCAGLCCVALAFDRSALFAEDKPAGTACRYLNAADRCAIHANRAERGFAGCAGYDCLGAGQLVTQELFGGQSWRSCGDGGQAMFVAFAQARRVQGWKQLLITARTLRLTQALEWRRQELLKRLLPAAGWTRTGLAQASGDVMAGEVAAFLRDLRTIA